MTVDIKQGRELRDAPSEVTWRTRAGFIGDCYVNGECAGMVINRDGFHASVGDERSPEFDTQEQAEEWVRERIAQIRIPNPKFVQWLQTNATELLDAAERCGALDAEVDVWVRRLANVRHRNLKFEALLRKAMGAAIRDALACRDCAGGRCQTCEPAQRWIDDAKATLDAQPESSSGEERNAMNDESKCECASIMAHDASRHFKECPKRGEFPEPAVARANAAEKRATESEAAFLTLLRESSERVSSALAEQERLRNVIRTGGAMYRAERAILGIPGGIDPADMLGFHTRNEQLAAELFEERGRASKAWAALTGRDWMETREPDSLIHEAERVMATLVGVRSLVAAHHKRPSHGSIGADLACVLDRLGEESADRGDHIRKLRGSLANLAAQQDGGEGVTGDNLREVVRWSIEELPELADRP